MATTVETRVIVKGVNEFSSALEGSVAAALIAARRIVERGALLIASEAKKNFRPRPGGQMTSQKSGKIYYSYAPPFQAVPPQPTSRSGALQTSLNQLGAATPIPGGWMATTGTKLSYAPYVEYGTGFMQKEPFLEKAVKDSELKIRAIADEEWAKAVSV